MERQLKRRLVGTAVIVTLVVVFLPLIIEDPHRPEPDAIDQPLPPRPEAFESRIEPLEPLPPLPEPVDVGEPLATGNGPPQGLEDAAEQTGDSRQAPERPSTEPGGPPLRTWLIQVGSFNQESNALGLRDRLRDKGYPAFVEETARGARTIYRVRVGPEASRTRAESVRGEIERAVNIEGMVIAHPG